MDYCPWTGAAIEDSKSEDVSGTGGTIPADESPTGGQVTVSGSGIPAGTTVTSSKYTGNPGGTPTFEATGDYYDVHLDSDAGVNSLTIEFCQDITPDTVIYYWDGTSWKRASDQHYDPVSGCIVVTVTVNTHPSLQDLTGLPLTPGNPPAPVGGETYPMNKLAILAPWIALIAAIIVGASLVVLRRRRTVRLLRR